MSQCSLQGIVASQKLKETLLQRLVGLCGKDSQLDFYEHEVGANSYRPCKKRRRTAEASLESHAGIGERAWQAAMPPRPPRNPHRPHRHCAAHDHRTTERRCLQVYGLAGIRVRIPKFRTLHNPPLSINTPFQSSFAFELVRKGYSFVYNDTLRITVTQMFKTQYDLATAEPVLGPAHADAWLVEATSAFVTQENVNQTAEQLVKFKGLLSGIVELEYMDHRSLQNRVQYT
ncbi:hypothetical protein BC936DRAFT_136987 [Jimgerdemannia flammicorona]|uniref:Mediator of RNA polymerase II transcription subunit 18 n=1 Tax=Jimgerdemannia flammicorona TaxID=994334 RepID=A0A433CYB6_9FUNG|nr:hypothetical protein BC936DRAFT_136987 [Jimgerdemannia flammicorona]